MLLSPTFPQLLITSFLPHTVKWWLWRQVSFPHILEPLVLLLFGQIYSILHLPDAVPLGGCRRVPLAVILLVLPPVPPYSIHSSILDTTECTPDKGSRIEDRFSSQIRAITTCQPLHGRTFFVPFYFSSTRIRPCSAVVVNYVWREIEIEILQLSNQVMRKWVGKVAYRTDDETASSRVLHGGKKTFCSKSSWNVTPVRTTDKGEYQMWSPPKSGGLGWRWPRLFGVNVNEKA